MADIEKAKIAMMIAASKALDYSKVNPKAESEEIFQHIMKEIPATGFAKAAAIAAVDKALRYKERENLKEREILQRIMNEADAIISNVG
jgi:hypothetical protein